MVYFRFAKATQKYTSILTHLVGLVLSYCYIELLVFQPSRRVLLFIKGMQCEVNIPVVSTVLGHSIDTAGDPVQ